MPFFILAMIPGGNILRTIGEIKRLSSRKGLGCAASWLPDGIYLGFYAGQPGFRLSRSRFSGLCAGVFEAMPPLFEFSRSEPVDNDVYIVPNEPIAGIAHAASEAAAAMGLSTANAGFFSPGFGFFIGKDVTLPSFKAFSFRHLDLSLLKIETGGAESLAAAWTVLAKTPRRVGPRSRILEE